MRKISLKVFTVFFIICIGTHCAFCEETITLKSPLFRQVFQRDKQGQANIIIAGFVPGDAEVIEAKADLSAGASRGHPVDWTVIAQKIDILSGKFTGMISLKEGGWYTVSIRARRGDLIVGNCKVEKVGVGDVFITAGQSNSANYGLTRQKAKDDRVVYYDGKNFVSAEDPIPGGCGEGGSPWPLLGDLIVASEQIPVCFRSTTLAATEVKDWMPGTKLYENLVHCVQAFGKNGVRVVLWHQGESDSLAKTPAEIYYKRLKTIIDMLSEDAGYYIPWFVAQASYHPGSREPEQKEVTRGQQLLWEKQAAYKGAVTDDLLGAEYRGSSDGVHFNQRGLSLHAQRWFEALQEQYKWKTGVSK